MLKGSCKATVLLPFCWLLSRDVLADAANALDAGVVITGTRIVRDGYAASTPVTVALAEDLLKVSPGNLPDALNKLPEFQLSSSPSRSTHNFANSAANNNILNLRGVGGIRTLVLFDGIRVAPTSYRGEVDIDALPKLLVQRVDIVTAGASSAYGSDAVAGVVNFVLDHQFSGVKAVAQAGGSTRGDNQQHRFGVATGFDVFAAQGHVLLSAELYKHEGMLRSERASARQNYTFAGKTGIGAPGSASNPLVVYDDVKQNIASEYGQIVAPAGSAYQYYRFGADGSLAPFKHGAPTGTPGYEIGGDGFAIPADNTAIAPSDTQQFFARFDLPFSSELSAFAQASLARNRLSYSSLANSFIAPTTAMLYSGNPYLPAAIQNSFTASDDFISLARYGGTEPKPTTNEHTDVWTLSSGVSGYLGNWRWSTAYTRSDATHDVAQANIWNFQHAYAALDAVRDASGQIVCRATLSADAEVRGRYADCQPLNPLLNGAAFIAQPGYAYATGSSRYIAKLTQDSLVATLTGSAWSLPAGPIDVAVGAEYRRQALQLRSNADPAALDTQVERAAYFSGLRGVTAQTPAYWLTNVGTADGQARVNEVFSELNAPVVDTLQLNGAVRLTHYQTSGNVTTWKLGAQWSPMASARWRATYSADIRAPSLFELYAGPQQGIGLLIDPRSGKTGNVNSIAGGNPNLQPERANTTSFGVVLSPTRIPELKVSIDYYRMRIRDQIGTLSITQIAQNCYANATAPECQLIDQADSTQLPTAIRVVPANLAFLETSGVDVDASWNAQLAGGEVSLRLYASYLDSFRTQQSSRAPIYDFAGYGQTANQPIGRPHLRGMLNLSYSRQRFEVFLSEQFIGGLKVGSQEPNQNYAGAKIGSVTYTDITGSWRIPLWSGRAELFVTINNVFDRNPPLIPGTIPGLNSPTIISLYDIVGRAFIGGARFSF